MVANAKMHRDFDAIQSVLQPFIIFLVTPIGQVAGNYQRIGIGVMRRCVIKSFLKVLVWLSAANGFTRLRQMDIGELQNFHGLTQVF
jgi:hypothetical protein